MLWGLIEQSGYLVYVPASRATPLARRPGRMQIYGEPNWGTWQWENVLKSWIKFLVTLIITIKIYNDPHHHDNVIPIKVHIILDIVALACTGWWSVHGGRSGNRNERRALSVRCLFPEQCSVSISIFQTNLKVFVMNIPIPDCTQAWISSPVSRCLWCTRRPHGQARKREPTKVQELVCLQSGLTLVIILPPAKVFLSLAGWQQRSSQDNSPGKPWRDTLSRRHRTCCAGPTDVWNFEKRNHKFYWAAIDDLISKAMLLLYIWCQYRNHDIYHSLVVWAYCHCCSFYHHNHHNDHHHHHHLSGVMFLSW